MVCFEFILGEAIITIHPKVKLKLCRASKTHEEFMAEGFEAVFIEQRSSAPHQCPIIFLAYW